MEEALSFKRAAMLASRLAVPETKMRSGDRNVGSNVPRSTYSTPLSSHSNFSSTATTTPGAPAAPAVVAKKRTWTETFDDLFRARLEPYPVRSRLNAVSLARNNPIFTETPGSSGVASLTPTHSGTNSEKTRERDQYPVLSGPSSYLLNQSAMLRSQQHVLVPAIAPSGVVTPSSSASPACDPQRRLRDNLLDHAGRASSGCSSSSSSHGSGRRDLGSEAFTQQRPDSVQAVSAAVTAAVAAPAKSFPRPASMEGLSALHGVRGARSFLARECMSQPQSREATPIEDKSLENVCSGTAAVTPDCKRARLLAEVKRVVASSPPQSVLAATFSCPMLTKSVTNRLRHHRVAMLRDTSSGGRSDRVHGLGKGTGQHNAVVESKEDKDWPVLFGVRLVPSNMSA